MSNGLFITMLALIAAPLLFRAYRILPGEKWQIAAAIPARKDTTCPDSRWYGSNVTFYGILLATGGLLGVVTFAFLLGCFHITLPAIAGLSGVIMIASVIAARAIARLVEKKNYTLTVAGGATAGLYLMPPVLWLYNQLFSGHQPIALMPVMAALATGYIIGEGVGRLACISFGCCYGKPVHETGALAKKLFSPIACTYRGDTKKIVYASGLGGVKVVPIQAITSFLYVQAGFAGMYLYLQGRFGLSFILTTVFALAWRIFSERFRADYRGEGKLTAYQIMGIVNIFTSLLLFLLAPDAASGPLAFHDGLLSLWDPMALVFFQSLWLMLFLSTGFSKVTGSTIAFHVRKERI